MIPLLLKNVAMVNKRLSVFNQFNKTKRMIMIFLSLICSQSTKKLMMHSTLILLRTNRMSKRNNLHHCSLNHKLNIRNHLQSQNLDKKDQL